jgi:hypothetical protein
MKVVEDEEMKKLGSVRNVPGGEGGRESENTTMGG